MDNSHTEHASAQASIFQIVLSYTVLSALWILFSDKLVIAFFEDSSHILLVNTLKGWFFVAVTSMFLWWGLHRVAHVDDWRLKLARPQLRRSLWILAIAVLLLTLFTIYISIQQYRNKTTADLQAIAELKTSQISDWLKERQGDAEFLQLSPPLEQRHHNTLSQAAAAKLMPVYPGGNAALRIDEQGRILWRSTDATEHPTPALISAIKQVLQTGHILRLGPYLDSSGVPDLDYVIPLHDDARSVMVIQINPVQALSSMLQRWPSPSSSGETVLFRRDGDTVLYLNELRHQHHSALNLRVPISAREVLAAQVLRGEVRPGEVIEGQDYRGVAAIGVVQAVPGTDWYLIAKIDASELYETAARDVAWGGLAGLLTLFIIGAVLVVMRQQEQLSHVSEISQSQAERLQALQLLEAIVTTSEDAIYAKDLEGRYILANRSFARLVGHSPEHAEGKTDVELFPPELAQQLAHNDRQILEALHPITYEEEIKGLRGVHTHLTTKGPLKNADGQVIGLYGVSRDISQEKLAQTALIESEYRFRALVEQSLAGIYIIQGGYFRYANPRLASMLGYDNQTEMINKVSIMEIVAPEDRSMVMENIRRRLIGEIESIQYSFLGQRRDGGQVNLEVFGRRFDYGGHPAVIGMIMDITERKLTENALRESERRFHDIVEASADWIWEVDTQGVYTYVSDSVSKLLGYQPDEVLGRTPFDLMPADEALRVRALYDDIAAKKEAFRDLNNINCHKDGSLRYVQTTGIPILGRHQELLGYRGIDRDITARRQIEAALQESEKNFRQLFQESQDAMVVFSVPEWHFIAVNQAALDLFGVGSEALFSALTPWQLSPEEQADGQKSESAAVVKFSQALREGACHFEWQHQRLDGQRFIAEVLLTRINRGGHHVLHGSIRDISARKQAEEELRARNDELERFNQASIGREMDMIALKQLINELSQQLQQPAPFQLDFLGHMPESSAN